jgi:hypothetical protein
MAAKKGSKKVEKEEVPTEEPIKVEAEKDPLVEAEAAVAEEKKKFTLICRV